MFTGLIEEVGTVLRAVPGDRGLTLVTCARKVLEDLAVGDSIAMDGACLTVIARDAVSFTTELSEETLKRTTLGRLRGADPVNLERALTPMARLGGHFVTGHVDGVGTLLTRESRGDSSWFRFGVPADLEPLLVVKGSVAVDGVSLTVAALEPAALAVAVIPHTLGATTLGLKQPGDPVNLEADLLGKYVQRLLALGAV
ncbi:MAG: riboflavin synthase [candidate division NC10 bacterium]|nr:riboflavin synthase [candidate division NC10 bacterium]